MTILRISAGPATIRVRLRATPTAEALCAAVPFAAKARLCGHEVYFPTPVSPARERDATDVLAAGEVGFWLAGDAIALCFGPTPASRGDEMRLASPANVWADALDDLGALAAVRDGDAVAVSGDDA